MKKIIALISILLIMVTAMPSFSFAEKINLIENIQISLKNSENPKRLEVSFDLTEAIDLSEGNSTITFEYFTESNSNNTEAIYKKDKTWSGYLNSYDNYPSGERKYSSGAEKADYSDNIPATIIYTSVKTNANIDVTLVDSVRITVLRADGSGEKVIIHIDGSISNIEKIEVPIVEEDKNTGIRLESTTAELPADTILIALTGKSVDEKVKAVLVNIKNFIAFDIKLESEGKEILPDGKVKISIPVPEHYESSNLVVYRIDDDGTKIPYPVSITTKEGIKYAIFETDHFSTYVLYAESKLIGTHKKYIHGYVSGVDTVMKPDSYITREEAAQMIYGLESAKNEEESVLTQISGTVIFTDVLPGRWSGSAISYLKSKHWLTGYTDGSFKPNDPMTRAEFATLIAKVKDLTISQNTTEGSHWAGKYISAVKDNGYMVGTPDDSFRPDDPLKRSEAIYAANQMDGRYPYKENVIATVEDFGIPEFTDVPRTHWAYADIMEGAYTHDYRTVEEYGVLKEEWANIVTESMPKNRLLK